MPRSRNGILTGRFGWLGVSLALIAPPGCTPSRVEPLIDSEPEARHYQESLLEALKAAREAGAMDERARGDSEREVQAEASEGRYTVLLDVSRQVLRLHSPEDVQYDEGRSLEVPLAASFAAAGIDGKRFLPAVALGLKAKSFDDGLYAAVELALERGLGEIPSKTRFLEDLLGAVTQAPLEEGKVAAGALLATALRLGGKDPSLAGEIADRAENLHGKLLGDPLIATPLGFYSWSKELVAVYRRDRALQQELQEDQARALAEALGAGETLNASYGSLLRLSEKLTNPLVRADLREAAAALAEGAEAPIPASVSLFPPSRSHETELVKRLYGDRPIPEGFNLADELIARLRSGALNLQPRPDSGWYDHQTFALEALVSLEKMPEGNRLSISDSYRKDLEGLFKALLALTRETHSKQLEVPMVGAAPPGAILLTIRPGITVEPLVTYYLRRARSYAFVREALETAAGPDALSGLRRVSAGGPVNLPLIEELQLLEDLFRGAHQVAREEIGMTAAEQGAGAVAADSGEAKSLFIEWASRLADDPDLAGDVRMMVPVFYDIERRMYKVWAVLGVSRKPLRVGFERPPRVLSVRDDRGNAVPLDRVEVEFESERHPLAYLVTAEVYVKELLDRTRFREHCDRHRMEKAILENLR